MTTDPIPAEIEAADGTWGATDFAAVKLLISRAHATPPEEGHHG